MQLRSMTPLAALVLVAFAAGCGTDDTQTAGMTTDTVGMGTTTETTTPGMGTGMGTTAGTTGDAEAELDATIQAAEGGLTNLPVSAAVSNIEGWENRLRAAGDPSLQPIADNLASLRQELQSPSIDGAAVGRLLNQLGQQTTEAAAGADPAVSQRLNRLGTLLSQAGTQLSR
jgi:hypothetical protein